MISRRYRTVLARSASALTLALGTPAFATEVTLDSQPTEVEDESSSAGDQEADQADAATGVGLEEIIVTARRSEENIQRVPIPITVVTGERLAQLNIKDFFALNNQVGGVNTCCNNGNASFVNVRGITNGSPTYFAEVPTNPGGFANFFDVENVQVLKGPQGTLFGQASNAGAFVFVPRKPGDTFGGYVSVSAGSLGRREIQGAVDIPVADGNIRLRLAAQSSYRNGYILDITNNNKYGEQDYYTLRPSLVLKFGDVAENYTVFQYTHSQGRPLIQVISDFNMLSVQQAGAYPACLTAGNLSCRQAAFNGGSPAAFNALRDQVLATQIALGPYKVNGLSSGCAIPGDPLGVPGVGATGVTNLNYPRVACLYAWSEEYFLSNISTVNISDNITLRNIFGLRRSKSFSQPGDGEGSPLVIGDSGSPRNNTPVIGNPFWSDEVQLRGTLGPADLTVGAFFTETHNVPRVNYSLNFGNTTASRNSNSAKSQAVYGQGNFDLGSLVEGLTLTAGYRYTWDQITTQTQALNVNTLAVTNTTGGPNSPAGHAEFSAGSYTLQLQYQATPDTMFFLNNSKGYSTGGLQNVVGFERFEPDSLNNFEAGVKSTLYLGAVKARINASAYYGKYDNVKVTTTVTATNPTTGVTSALAVTQNAGAGVLKGIDAEGTFVLSDDLEIGGFYALTDSKYTKFPSILQVSNSPPTFIPIDLSSTPFSFVSKHKWGARGTYRLPLDPSAGNLSFTANYTYTGAQKGGSKPLIPTNPNNVDQTGLLCNHVRTAANGYGPLSADGKTVPLDCRPGYSNVDVSLDWRDVLGHDRVSASLIVTNVTANEKTHGGYFQNKVTSATGVTPAEPRMFIIRLGVGF